jgi:hypothetical protein
MGWAKERPVSFFKLLFTGKPGKSGFSKIF